VFLPFTALLYDKPLLSNSNFKRGGIFFLLPRKSQKLEFLAERFNFFGLSASFDIKTCQITTEATCCQS